MNSRRLITVLATAALAATLAAAGAAAPAAWAAPRTEIIKGMTVTWAPSTIEISTNDTIKWKAVLGAHTVTAYGGNWHFDRSLDPGTPVIRGFTQAGTFRFRCRIHSSLAGGSCTGMCGKVVVSA